MSTQSKSWTVGPAARRLLVETQHLVPSPKTSARREVKELKKLFEQHGAPVVDAQLSKWMGRGFKPRESALGTPLAKGVAGGEGAYYPVIGQADAPYGIVSGRKVNHGVMGTRREYWPSREVPIGVPHHVQQMRLDGWRAVDSQLPEGIRFPKLYGARQGQGNSQHLAVEHLHGKTFKQVKPDELPHIAPNPSAALELFRPTYTQNYRIPGWADEVGLGDLHGNNIMVPADRSGFVIVDPMLYRPDFAVDRFSHSGVSWSDKYVAQVAGQTKSLVDPLHAPLRR